jgi:outer membrane protein TolC
VKRSWLLAALASLPVSLLGADSVTIGDCVRFALARSPAVRASMLATDVARSRYGAARAAFLPVLSAEAEYGRSTGYDVNVTNGGSTKTVIKAEATLLDGGTRRAQVAAADARVRASGESEREERAAVTFAVREAYFSALGAAEEIAIRQQALDTLDRDVALLERQARSGLVPPNAVLRARITVESTRTAQRAAASDLGVRRAALAVLSGVDVSAPLVDPGEPPPLTADDAAIETLPGVVGARLALEAARRDRQSVERERWGKLTFSADAGALGVDPGTTFRDNQGAEVLAGVRVPLLDGVAAANIAGARAEEAAAQAALDRARQDARLEIAELVQESSKSKADLEAARRTLPLSEQNLELMRARHAGGGDVRLLELLDALAEHVNARLEVSHALLAYRLAAARAAKLLGDATP